MGDMGGPPYPYGGGGYVAYPCLAALAIAAAFIAAPFAARPISFSRWRRNLSPSFFRFFALRALSRNCFSILVRFFSGLARIRSISSFFSSARSLDLSFFRFLRFSYCAKICISSSFRSTSGFCSIMAIRSLSFAALARDWAFLRARRSSTSWVVGIRGLMYVLSRPAVTAPGTMSSSSPPISSWPPSMPVIPPRPSSPPRMWS
mmetsp:Transcript_12893/g.30439  ORF Transcript_12893/g.30439 Transcript_12893/m.30439 type:complete len:204 (+) Transcript_12893:542-1153(+)